jgi:glycosyltransferase involved in cell wall biosynthesis
MPASIKKNISVIIPTYNGGHKVINLLESLLLQSKLPDEVLIVIDGSTDDTKFIIEQGQFDLPFLRIIEQNNQGRAGVRNRGALEAKGDLLIFFDDDMILSENCIQEHVQHHLIYPNSILNGDLKPYKEVRNGEFYKYELWQTKRWSLDNKGSVSETTLLNQPYISACNFSLPKIVFNQLGGFDQRLTDAEDFDLAMSAQEMNVPIFLSKSAWAVHCDVNIKTFTKYIKRIRHYRLAQYTLIALKPERYQDKTKNKRYVEMPKGVKAIIFKLLAHKVFIKSLESKFWCWLPISVRFKLYDAIITANGVYYIQNVQL